MVWPRAGGVIIGLGVLLLFGSCSVAATEIEGGTVPAENVLDQEQIDQAESQLENAGLDTHLLRPIVVFGTDGNEYLVFAWVDAKTGYATVDVKAEVSSGPAGMDVVLAEEAWIATEGKKVEYQSLKSSPEEYEDQLIRFEAEYQQAAAKLQPEENLFAETIRHDVYGAVNSDTEILTNTISAGTWGFSQIALARQGEGQYPDLSGDFAATSDGESMWMDGRSRIDAVVIDLHERSLGQLNPGVFDRGRYLLLVSQAEPQVERTVTPDEVTNGDIEPGTRVKVHAPAGFYSTSIRDHVVSIAECAPNSVVFPGVGCLPITHDVTLHTGFAKRQQDDIGMLFAGLSTQPRDFMAPEPPYQGDYVLKGEVVEVGELGMISPYTTALRVEDIEKQSDAQVSPSVKNASQALMVRSLQMINYHFESDGELSPPERSFNGDFQGETRYRVDFAYNDSVIYGQYGEVGDNVTILIEMKNERDVRAGGVVNVDIGDEHYSEYYELDAGNSTVIHIQTTIQGERTREIVVNGDAITEIGHASIAPTDTPTPEDDSSQALADAEGGSSGLPLALTALLLVYLVNRRMWNSST